MMNETYRTSVWLGAILASSLAMATTYTFDVSQDRSATAEEITAVEALTASDTVLKKGDGKLTYGGQFSFAGTLQIEAGTFAVQSSGVVTNKMTLVGAGTFRQESGERVVEATNDLTPDSTNFTGDYVIAGGTNTLMAKSADISAKYGATSGKLVVDGGTLRTYASLPIVKKTSDYSNMTFGKKPVHLKGTGADGKGALLSDYYYYGLLKAVVLDGNATISTWLGPRSYTSQYITFGNAGSNICTVDFQGYDLTILDVPITSFNANSRLSDNGRLVIKSENVTRPSLSVYQNVDLGTPYNGAVLAFTGEGASLEDRRNGSFTRPIEIDLTGSLRVTPINSETNTYVKAPIVFKETNRGYLDFYYPGKALTNAHAVIDAPVTGPGRIVYSSDSKSGTYKQYESLTFNSHTNTLSGGIAMTKGEYGERLVLTHPDVVTDYAKIAATNGAVIVNGANWGSSNIFALAREARIKNKLEYAQNAVFVNTADCEDQTATIAVTDDDLADDMVPIGHDGPGTLVVSANAPTKPLALRMGGGAIKLTGEHLVLANAIWAQTLGVNDYLHADRVRESSVSFEDISDVSLSDGAFGEVPTAWPGRETPLVLCVKNSTLHDDRVATKSSSALLLGNNAASILQVEEGAKIDSTMNVGYKYAAGAVYQRGGEVYWRDAVNWETRGWLGYDNSAACGYYELAGGTLTNNNRITVGSGGAMTCGAFVQTGGRFDGYQMNLGSGHAFGLYDMKGGTAKLSRDITFIRSDAKNDTSEGSFIQEGGDVTANTVTFCRGSTNNLALMTLTGGRFSTADSLGKNSVQTTDTGVWSRPEWNKAYLNFNGGTLRWTGSGDIFVTNDLRAVDRITVFEKGAAIEVDASKTVQINQAFQAPEAGKFGVASVPWTGDFTTNVFVGPPAVRIFGDGAGATAVARFDSSTRTVTGIDMVAPGSGYTWAKAELAYGRSSSTSPWRVQTNDCVMTTETPASGDLVKKGAGTLQLTVPNTYGGDTVIEEGTLHIGCEGAVPEGSRLVMKGGAVTTASGLEVPPMHFDLKAGETLAYGQSVVVSDGSTVSVAGELDKEKSPYVLATFPNLQNAGVLTLTTELPADWRFRVSSTALRLVCKRGLCVIVR